ncbi:MAG: hypothetical protein KUF72_14255 [Candidatus Thiodiazotropha sp. (ex Ctena orbiculata)]|nr:hypothetical protein [Candidatus Thiodiazotropha taylori]
MAPLGGGFSLSGLDFVKKMVANYNTAFPQYQRFAGTVSPSSLTILTATYGMRGRENLMLRRNIQAASGVLVQL